MDRIKEIIAELTLDRRKQIIIVAFCFGGFLEGVAGAG
ncbi:L-lactate permease, partial [Fusobacterium necrophorum]